MSQGGDFLALSTEAPAQLLVWHLPPRPGTDGGWAASHGPDSLGPTHRESLRLQAATILGAEVSIVRSQHEQVLGMSSFAFGMLLITAGVLAYILNLKLKPAGWAPAAGKP